MDPPEDQASIGGVPLGPTPDDDHIPPPPSITALVRQRAAILWEDRSPETLIRVGLIAGTVLVAVVLVVIFATRPDGSEPWDPLSGYTLGVAERADLGDPVAVSAVECNDSVDLVEVAADVTWVLVAVNGVTNGQTEIPGDHLDQSLLPGCTSRVIRYRMPPRVVSQTRSALRDQPGETTWRIDGVDVPLDPDGVEGPARRWTSTLFTIESP